MLKDRVALDLPHYDGLLAGHYARGQGYGRRRLGGTDDWLLVMTLRGEGRFGSATGDVAALPGSLVLVAPGTSHDYGTSNDADEWEILWVHFHPPANWLELLHWPLAAPGIHALALNSGQEVEAAFWDVCRLSIATSPRRKQFAMNALERLLLLCDAKLPDGGLRLDDRIRAAVDYIHGHLRAALTLEELSALVHLSPSRFAHLFRSEMGMPPRQYVATQRLQRARTLLERTTLSITEIAGEIGMEPFHFSSRFRAETGQSPRDFRRTRAAVDCTAVHR